MNRPEPLSPIAPMVHGSTPVGATVIAVLLLALACGPGTGPSSAPPEIPRPDLGPMEPAARRQIEGQLVELDALASSGEAEPAELGAAVGELGRLYHAYGLEEAAEACYREAERLDPGEARWPYYLGFLLQVRGETAAAEAFERALELQPDDPATLIRLARARLDAGEIDTAEALFRSSLERHASTAAAAHAGLAAIAVARREHTAAVEQYRAALALQPAATRLHYPLGLAYKELGRTTEAEEHLELRGDAPVAFPDPLAAALDREAAGSALHVNRAGIALAEGRTQEALHEYRLAVAADPENATARGELGMLLAAGGDLVDARHHLEVAVRLEPANPAHLQALARVRAADGAEEEALPLFRQAVELDPSWASGHLQLAAALARSGRYPEALDSYERALELDSASAAARLGRAEVLLELGRLASAVEDLEAVLRAEPENGRASLRLGEARQRLGETAAAQAAFEAALAGDLDPLERTAALLGTANMLATRGDLAAAVDRYREVLELAPGLEQAELNLARALTVLGREDEALVHYRGLVARQPSNLRARAYRGRLLLRRGRAEEALRDFEYVLDREPDSAAAHLGVAGALQAAGRWSEARQRLESSLARLPGETMLTESLARLLASCPDPALRDGERAIRLARGLMEADSSPDHAETMAMALAAVGRYGEAAELQRRLLGMARSAGAPAGMVQRLQANLARYEAGSPCCAPPAS